jgi:hypothetical protein
MTAAYRIEPSRIDGLLHVVLTGFFELEDLQPLHAALRDGVARLHYAPGRHMALYDVSECKIQSQEVLAAFRQMSGDRSTSARKIAFVTGASLVRMQIKRVVDPTRDAGVFDDLASAEHWLADEPALQRRAARH